MRPDPASVPLLRRLHRRVFVDPEVRAVLDAGFLQLAAQLKTRPAPPHATCMIPIELFTGGMNDRAAGEAHDRATREQHDQVRLCRLFLMRRGARMAVPERHTNSVQRLVSYRGRGWIHQGVPGGPAVNLRARMVGSRQEGCDERLVDEMEARLAGPAHAAGLARLAAFWDIVPAGVWHYPEADGGEDWATVTFHSAPEDEIVDETPTEDDSGPTLT